MDVYVRGLVQLQQPVKKDQNTFNEIFAPEAVSTAHREPLKALTLSKAPVKQGTLDMFRIGAKEKFGGVKKAYAKEN